MKTEISFAKPEDESQLKRTFLNCFDDTLGFVNMLFLHHFAPQNTVVIRADGKIIGEAMLFPCSVGGRPYYYGYGICIEKAFRSQGLGLSLLQFITEKAERENAGFVLHPENSSLFGFYEKAGLVPCSRQSVITKKVLPGGGSLLPVSPAEYKDIRERRFNPETLLRWDLPSVEYAVLQEQFFGGFCFKTVAGGKTEVLLGTIKNGVPVIKETTAQTSALDEIAAAVGSRFGSDSVIFRLPYLSGESETVGYGFSVCGNLYMNLLLD